MFSRSKRREAGAAKTAPRSGAAPSLISHDLRVIGDLLSDGDLQIDGLVEGDVRSRNVTVGETAVVKGSIAAQKARIRGHVEGEITARTVALAKTATVQGDILHESISIEAGAYIDGRCRRFDEQAQLDDHTDIRGALSAPSSDDTDDPAMIEHQSAEHQSAAAPSANPFAAAGRTASVIPAPPPGAGSPSAAVAPDPGGTAPPAREDDPDQAISPRSTAADPDDTAAASDDDKPLPRAAAAR